MARVLSQEALDKIGAACTHYPTKMAALLPAVHLVMDDQGYVSADAELDIAEALDVPPTRVHEVVTFYTMFYDREVGRHIVKICRNLACQLRGADRIIERAQEILGIKAGETTPDGRITLDTDECLASCGTGPMAWCRSRIPNGDGSAKEVKEWIAERLDEERLEQLLRELT